MSKIIKQAKSEVRPSLAFYHPNNECTGSAVKFSLLPAKGSVRGMIKITIANEEPVVIDEPYDWRNAANVDLYFNDICYVLHVLCGECDEIKDGVGVYYDTDTERIIVRFRHSVDPIAGYSLEVIKVDRKTCKDTFYNFIFNPAEACGLREVLAGAMHRIAFGD